MKYFDTFTGIGGFTLAINKAYENNQDRQINKLQSINATVQDRWDSPNTLVRRKSGGCNSTPDICVGYSEIDKYASSIYQKHYPNHKNYGDITKIRTEDLPDFDLLVGGFPCQAFSIAGKRGGFEDTRGTLFFELARILRDKKPRLFVFENVKGLLSHDKGNTFKTIISTLDELGYDTQWQVLNSKNFGVPQNRERVFIVGHLRGTSRPEVFPIRGANTENFELNGVSKATNPREISRTLLARDYKDPKLVADYRYVESAKIRRLTPVECERLQGFKDNWTRYGENDTPISDTQRYKCCGNAVTVNVVQAIMEKLL